MYSIIDIFNMDIFRNSLFHKIVGEKRIVRARRRGSSCDSPFVFFNKRDRYRKRTGYSFV